MIRETAASLIFSGGSRSDRDAGRRRQSDETSEGVERLLRTRRRGISEAHPAHGAHRMQCARMERAREAKSERMPCRWRPSQSTGTEPNKALRTRRSLPSSRRQPSRRARQPARAARSTGSRHAFASRDHYHRAAQPPQGGGSKTLMRYAVALNDAGPPTRSSAASPRAPSEIRMASAMLDTKIIPSPRPPVRHCAWMTRTRRSA